MTSDPFVTAALRQAVLGAWATSPARFREDANAEEALAVGGYADRLLIELAANALDAARQAGVPGRIRFALCRVGGIAQLRAANVGAPLDAAGVAGLASLRASAKRGRGATVGHFGVGFTAVLAVTDAPEVVSRTGAIRFSRAETATAIGQLLVPALDVEVAARDGQVPVLRLPWPIDTDALQADPIPEGFDTQVRLPLRDGIGPTMRKLLDEIGDDLLWALPGLRAIEIEMENGELRKLERQDAADGRTVIRSGDSVRRYRAVTRSGTIASELLADRPIEERGRDQWMLTWALPESTKRADLRFAVDEPLPPTFLGAPTPTDEPLSLPARLVGTFPVDDTRRRLAPGALGDHLLTEAAMGYVELFDSVPAPLRLSLVPAAGFPVGPVDASLRERILRRLSGQPVLVTALDEPVVPAAAVVILRISDPAAVLLARAVPGLLRAPRSPAELEALRVLSVTTMPLAEATTALAGLDGSPSFWHQVYESLADQPTEDLANLPVPLSGGGRRIGPAGCLLPGTGSVSAQILALAADVAPDLRIIHPEAASGLLSRLGAVPADADALVADPALIQAFVRFREDLEDSDPDFDELRELARLALALAAEATLGADLFDEVVLTNADGEAWPANELLAPGAPLAAVLAPDADLPVLAGEWASYPQDALARVGVRTGFKVVRVENSDADLPDLRAWWSEVVGSGLPPESFDAIADLDLIDDGRWAQALAMIAADRDARATLTSGPEPSYTRWFLARSALLAGRRPGFWRSPGAVELSGLYDVLPPQITVDTAVAQAIGMLVEGADALTSDAAGLLRRWSDWERRIPFALVPGITLLAVEALAHDPELALPATVRTLSGGVVEAAAAMVLDAPWLAQVVDPGRLVAGGADPERVARLFDLDLASESVQAELPAMSARSLTVNERHAAERAAFFLGCGLDELFSTGTLRTVDGLRVRMGTEEIRISWWPVSENGSENGAEAARSVLTDGSPAGLGRAVAWRAGRWDLREVAASAATGTKMVEAENGIR